MEIEKVTKTQMTKVDYFGEKFYVPDWVNFIVTNKSGAVFGYEREPKANNNYFFALGRECNLHTHIKFKDHKNVWKESVRNVQIPFKYGSMKLLKYKTVNYYGLKLSIPENMNYIAIDGVGTITCFENEPRRAVISWIEFGDHIVVGEAKLVTEHGWKYSLRKV